MTEAELSTKLTEAETTVATLTKRVEDAEFGLLIAKLDAEDQEAYASLSEPEQTAFRAADEETRKNMLTKARNIHKSDDSEMPEEIRKQFEDVQKQLKETKDQLTIAQEVAKRAVDAQQLVELAKRAEDEFGGLPGTPQEKALVLKSLTKLSKEEQTGVETLLKAGNACLVGMTKPVGKDVGTSASGDAWTQIENLAKAKAAAEHISQAEAVSKVLDENPKLYMDYNMAAAQQK